MSPDPGSVCRPEIKPGRVAALFTLIFLAMAMLWWALVQVVVMYFPGVNGYLPHISGVMTCFANYGTPLFVLGSAAVLFFYLRRKFNEQGRRERELFEANEQLQLAVEGSEGATWCVDFDPARPDDPERGVTHPSSQLLEILGYAAGETTLTLSAWRNHILPEDREHVLRTFADYVKGRIPSYTQSYRVRRRDGAVRWVRTAGCVFRDAAGRPVRWAGVLWDVTDQETARERAKLTEHLFDHAYGSFVIADPGFRLVAVNKAFERMSGYAAAELVGQPMDAAAGSGPRAETLAKVWPVVNRAGVWIGQLELQRKDGSRYLVSARATAVRDEIGAVTHHTLLMSDVTELETSRQKARFLAHYDALTRLPNATRFTHQLNEALRRAKRSGVGLAVLCVDLARFQAVNDSIGAERADRVLVEVAQCLGAACRGDECIGRIHGDTFGLIVEPIAGPRDATRIAQRVLDELARGFVVNDKTLYLGAHIGISLFPLDGADGEELLHHAEAALTDARNSGAGQYHFYRRELTELANVRVRIVSDLRQALTAGALACHFQPKVELASGAPIGAEALVRWRHDGQWLEPSKFIPVAEEAGLIDELGRWMLREAATAVARWRMHGLVGPDFNISINVAGSQIKDALVEDLRGVLEHAQLPASMLSLELTESMILRHPESAQAVLRRLRALGVAISLDDFGTGYSSLSQLQRLPLDQLKIDQSFVRGLPDSPEATALTRAIIALGHSLNLTVIAEGVETEPQRQALLELGCALGQGYLFGKAVSAPDFEALLRAQARPTAYGGRRLRHTNKAQ